MIRPLIIAALAGLALAGCSSGQSYRDREVALVPAPSVDLDRYMGRWFEIARFPNRAETGCVGVTADYAMAPAGSIEVVNTCRIATLAGPVERVTGTARPAGAGGAKLKVSFTGWLPVWGANYWILDVDPDYRVAVVGAPDGEHGWILAREPTIPAADMRHAYDVLWRNGYDLTQIVLVDQPGVGS